MNTWNATDAAILVNLDQIAHYMNQVQEPVNPDYVATLATNLVDISKQLLRRRQEAVDAARQSDETIRALTLILAGQQAQIERLEAQRSVRERDLMGQRHQTAALWSLLIDRGVSREEATAAVERGLRNLQVALGERDGDDDDLPPL